jgi:methionine-rich copper-binding protein CopC
MLLISIAPASAHTSLLNSAPAEGEILKSLPAAIELTFNEPILKVGSKEVSQILLRDPKNKLVNLGEVLSSDKTVSAKILEKSTNNGLYKIYYRAVAEDGHPISGQINFSIGNEDLSSQITDIAANSPRSSNLIFAGIVTLIASVLSLLIWLRRNRR